MKKNILLVATGSVAVVKTKKLYEMLNKNYNIKVIISPFVEDNFPVDFPYEKEDKDLNSFPLHIKHAKWADLIVVAPASANTLSKFAYGISDNQVLTTLIAARCSILFAPAMNTYMWEAMNQRQTIDVISKYGHMFIGPNSGKLREGEVGMGRISEPEEIFDAINNYFIPKGKKVLIVNGASKVYIDPIRFISNDSTGSLGRMISNEARIAGHIVKLIDASSKTLDEIMNIIKASDFDVYISPAALSDFKIKKYDSKIKKASKLNLELEADVDIISYIKTLGKEIIAFKHDDEKSNAISKLKKLNAKLIVWNKIGSMGRKNMNGALIWGDKEFNFNNMPKSELAKIIVKEI